MEVHSHASLCTPAWECTGMHESALGSWSALGCKRVHWDVWECTWIMGVDRDGWQCTEMHKSALACMREQSDDESALGCIRVHLDHGSALGCMRVHLDHGRSLGWDESALLSWECTRIHQSALATWECIVSFPDSPNWGSGDETRECTALHKPEGIIILWFWAVCFPLPNLLYYGVARLLSKQLVCTTNIIAHVNCTLSL